MSLLLFEKGSRRFNEIVRPGMLCAFDFDGTLAPIVAQPQRAGLPAAILRRLQILKTHAPVAIVSGRSADDIGTRLAFVPDYVIGNHGIEGVQGWPDRRESYRQLCLAWERHLRPVLENPALFDPAVWIEHKCYSLSVHYRLARDQQAARAALSQLFAGLTPAPRIVAGKCVFNLLPAQAPDKGAALARLCDHSGASSAIYVGDDVTDEDVFRLHRRDWLTVRIERDSGSHAEFHLHHRLDMVQLLDTLIQRLTEVNRSSMPQ